MAINKIYVTFIPSQTLKHSRKGYKLDTFESRAYNKPELCVNKIIFMYANRTQSAQLIITYGKPYKPASTDFVGCGLKIYLRKRRSSTLRLIAIVQPPLVTPIILR